MDNIMQIHHFVSKKIKKQRRIFGTQSEGFIGPLGPTLFVRRAKKKKLSKSGKNQSIVAFFLDEMPQICWHSVFSKIGQKQTVAVIKCVNFVVKKL